MAFRVVSANLLNGGMDRSGSCERADKAIDAIGPLQASVICLQEVKGTRDRPENPGWDMPLAERDRIVRAALDRMHDAARRRLHYIADGLDMAPVLGPPMPGGWNGLCTAILVSKGIEVTGTGPRPMAVPGAENPAWTQAVIRVPGIPHPIAVYSVHLPASNKAQQKENAERLANHAFQEGMLTTAAGDFNAPPRTEQATEDELLNRKTHLRPVRMHLDDGPLRLDYAVYDTLTGTGFVDIAASLPHADLAPTGQGGSRVDWQLATGEMARAAIRYRLARTGASDHAFTVVDYDRAALAAAVPPGPRD